MENRPYFELWETRTKNLVAAYRTLDEAVAFVCDRLGRYGRSAIETLALDEADEAGNGTTIAFGFDEWRQLIDRAQPSAAAAGRR